MAVSAPKIDSRTADDIVKRTVELAARDSGWQPDAHPQSNPDLGWALVNVFAGFAELVIERLNRVPDKKFLAFLDLLGLELQPPQPARVPLTFYLAEGSMTEPMAPAGTQVTAPPPAGQKDPIVYETESGLIVTRSQLVAVYTLKPNEDLYADRTSVLTGGDESKFDVFGGVTDIPHAIYLGSLKRLSGPGVKDVTLVFTQKNDEFSWSHYVAWEFWNGKAWEAPNETLQDETSSNVTVTLKGVPPVPPVKIPTSPSTAD